MSRPVKAFFRRLNRFSVLFSSSSLFPLSCRKLLSVKLANNDFNAGYLFCSLWQHLSRQSHLVLKNRDISSHSTPTNSNYSMRISHSTSTPFPYVTITIINAKTYTFKPVKFFLFSVHHPLPEIMIQRLRRSHLFLGTYCRVSTQLLLRL